MKSRQLLKYASQAELMNITVRYEGKKYTFNLYDELKVEDNTLNREVREQSISFAFLLVLLKRLQGRASSLEFEIKKAKAKLWLKHKDNSSQRMTKEDLKLKVDSNPRVLLKEKNYLKLRSEIDLLEASIKAFEQRSNQIQTLSANIRKTS